jgi:hypothetical protein
METSFFAAGTAGSRSNGAGFARNFFDVVFAAGSRSNGLLCG